MDTIARTTKQLADALRRYRRNKDLSQIGLAERMQVRQATISKLEAGEPATQLRVLMDALTALDLELVIRPRTKTSVQDIADLF
jgi:HTH-type transcriptional regulator / antitoxin HipB